MRTNILSHTIFAETVVYNYDEIHPAFLVVYRKDTNEIYMLLYENTNKIEQRRKMS